MSGSPWAWGGDGMMKIAGCGVAVAALAMIWSGEALAAQRWRYAMGAWADALPVQGVGPEEMELALAFDRGLSGATMSVNVTGWLRDVRVEGALLHADGRAELFEQRPGGRSIYRWGGFVRREDGAPRRFEIEPGDQLRLVFRFEPLDWVRPAELWLAVAAEVEGRPYGPRVIQAVGGDEAAPLPAPFAVASPGWYRWTEWATRGFRTRIRGPRSHPPKSLDVEVKPRGMAHLLLPCVSFVQNYNVIDAVVDVVLRLESADGERSAVRFPLAGTAESGYDQRCLDSYTPLGDGDRVAARFKMRRMPLEKKQFLNWTLTLDLKRPPEPEGILPP